MAVQGNCARFCHICNLICTIIYFNINIGYDNTSYTAGGNHFRQYQRHHRQRRGRAAGVRCDGTHGDEPARERRADC